MTASFRRSVIFNSHTYDARRQICGLDVYVPFWTYPRNWQKDDHDVQNNIRDPVRVMQRDSVYTLLLMPEQTPPISIRMSSTDEEEAQEVAKSPNSNNHKNRSANPVESLVLTCLEYAAIKENKARLCCHQSWNLHQLGRPVYLHPLSLDSLETKVAFPYRSHFALLAAVGSQNSHPRR